MRHDELYQNLQNFIPTRPHFTLRYAAKKILSGFLNQEKNLQADLVFQRNILKKRAERLTEVLFETGWEPLPPSGGLFMTARPLFYEGKKLVLNTEKGEKIYTLNASNIHEALFFTTNLLINNDIWTGIPDFCRFVLSVNEEDFQKALKALRKFRALFD
jgi:methionine S-methyltransferase